MRSFIAGKDKFDRPERLYLTREKSYVMVDSLREDFRDQLWMLEEINGLFKIVDIFTDDSTSDSEKD